MTASPHMLASGWLADAAPPPLDPHRVLTVWQFAPQITVALAVVAAVYGWAVLRVRRRHPARPWPWRHTVAFLVGLAVVAIATQSSVGAYDDVLFWVHMVQHLLLIMVAPPLLVLGRPILLAMHASRGGAHRAIRAAVRSRPARLLTCPPVALALYAAVIIGTHLTGFMNLVLTHPLVHDGEHVLYLAVGYLFFLPAVGTEPIRWRLSYPARLALLAVAMPVDTFTGVVLGLTTREPFPAYAANPRPWGPTLIGDLHLGGAIMWVGGDGLMVAMMAVLAVAFLRSGTGGAGVGRWVEAARTSALAEHTAAAGIIATPGRTGTVDDDAYVEAHRDAYNAWLASLDQPPAGNTAAGPAPRVAERKDSA